MDLETMLNRLAALTPAAEQRYQAHMREQLKEDDYELEGDLWLSLERTRGGFWLCGWRYQPDEMAVWVISANGDTPTEAAGALLALMEAGNT